MKGVRLYDTYFKCDEVLSEYLIDFADGTIAVKIIASDNPSKILKEYYKKMKF